MPIRFPIGQTLFCKSLIINYCLLPVFYIRYSIYLMISKRNDERENYFFFLLYDERWVFNKLQANKKSLIINRLRMIWISCANKIPLRVCPNGNFIRVFRRFVLSGGVQTDRQGLSWWEVCNWLYSLSYRELPCPTLLRSAPCIYLPAALYCGHGKELQNHHDRRSEQRQG